MDNEAEMIKVLEIVSKTDKDMIFYDLVDTGIAFSKTTKDGCKRITYDELPIQVKQAIKNHEQEESNTK